MFQLIFLVQNTPLMTKALIIASEFPPQPGGIGNHALYLAKGMHAKGFKVKLISDTRSSNGKEESDFDKDLSFEVIRIPRKNVIFFSYFLRFKKAFDLSRDSDIVISSGKYSLWVGAVLSLFFKRKFVAIVHGSEVKLPNKFLKQITDLSLKKYSTVIAVSNYTKSLLSHLKLESVVVIPNGYTLKTPTNFVRKEIPGPILITVGNVTKRKGQHNVIKALPGLLKKYPDLKYHIVGIPTGQVKLEKTMLKMGVESAVVFYGEVSESLKLELLQEADIFVMLSEATVKGDVEGFGIAILEANALGVPAIGARGCGIEDAVKHGFSGQLIPPQDPEQLEQAVEQILANYGTYSRQARIWSQDFTWDKIIKRYLKVLRAAK